MTTTTTTQAYYIRIWLLILSSTFFCGRPFARSMFIPHERFRSATPLGVTRVNRTILQGRCCPYPFCARILDKPAQRERGKLCMILLHFKQNKAKLRKKCAAHYVSETTRVHTVFFLFIYFFVGRRNWPEYLVLDYIPDQSCTGTRVCFNFFCFETGPRCKLPSPPPKSPGACRT